MRRIALIALGIIAAAPAGADTLRLAWDHPMPDVVAYRVFCGADPAVRVTAPPYTFEKTGTWSGACAVTAISADGRESDKSQSTGVVDCVAGKCTVPPNAACIVTVPVTYIVAPNGTYTTRPLYDRPGGARIGAVEIKTPAGTPRACDGGDALLVTTSGEWRYTTNNAGRRGAALCKKI